MQYACCGWKVENVVKGKMWFMRNNEKGKLWDICQHLSETAFFCGGGMIIIRMIMIMIMVMMMIIIIIAMILLLSDGPISGANRGVFVRGQWPVGRFLSLTFSLHFWQSFNQLLFSLPFYQFHIEPPVVFIRSVKYTHLWRYTTIASEVNYETRKTVQIVYVPGQNDVLGNQKLSQLFVFSWQSLRIGRRKRFQVEYLVVKVP